MQTMKVTLTTVAAALMLASCQPQPVDTVAQPTVSAPAAKLAQHGWQSCADKYPNPTDGVCEAYDRAAMAHGLIRTEDGSYVTSSYYDGAALGAL